MPVAYECGTDLDWAKSRFAALVDRAYKQGWADAAEALRLFAECPGLRDHPDVQHFLIGAADALIPPLLDKSKMI